MSELPEENSSPTFFACSFNPEPREGAAFNLIKKGNSDVYILYGGRDNNGHFHDTWELSLSPLGWTKITANESNVKNTFNGFIQQVKPHTKERTLLVGGVNENNESDLPTRQRDFTSDTWNSITAEDKLETFDNTPDTVDWVGLVKIRDTKNLAPDITCAMMASWDSGSGVPFKYHHPNSWKWRTVYKRDKSKIIQAYGSYIWVEWPDSSKPCRLYMLGGFDKNGNTLKKFQRVDLRADSNQPVPFPVNNELFYFTNHTILANENSSLFTVDPSTPLFQGDPLVADGIGSIRTGCDPESRLNVPNSEVTASTCTGVFPLNTGVWDDSLGWLDRNQLETHVVLPFSSVAETRLIELYIIADTGEIKVRVPLEDFGPHPEIPQNRVNFSLAPLPVDSNNETTGFVLFGGSVDGEIQNDLWQVDTINVGTSDQRFVWTRLN